MIPSDAAKAPLVDDIADNRNILARRFQKRNFDVVEADCGTAALELIAARSFDTILLDVMMPDMSGLEVLRRIRSAHTPESSGNKNCSPKMLKVHGAFSRR